MSSQPAFANQALNDELEAINSIYGSGTLQINPRHEASTRKAETAILQLPNQPFAFLLSFEDDYPETAPRFEGLESTYGSGRGEGKTALETLRKALQRIYTPGSVCLFDLIEEVGSLIGHAKPESNDEDRSGSPDTGQEEVNDSNAGRIAHDLTAPTWVMSDTIAEKKSIFVARCAAVSSKDEASSFLTHLGSTNKKVATATHNITAWRLQNTDTGVIVQDCDDDGETAAGGRLLRLMQLMDVWNVVVVVTRWYGGVKLGPDRFRIINAVARDALLRGRFVKSVEKSSSKKKGKH